MPNVEIAKKEFDRYVKSFDFEEICIKRKYTHSYRVMEFSKNIAESLDLIKEKVEIATIIGLLHDIARFEQWTRYKTFVDKLSIDHGDFGVEILDQNNFIRNFVEQNNYDTIIKTAIKNHNKYKIEMNLSEEEVLFSKIIRDADKIDILYEANDFFWEKAEEIDKIENSYVSEEYYNQFIYKIQIKRIKNQTALDSVILLIAFIFDINFEYSKKEIYDSNIINKILDKFKFKNEKGKVQVETIREIANNYLKENI